MTKADIIASFIVRLPDNKRSEIEKTLTLIETVEVHAYENGKMLITINSPNEDGLFHQYKSIKQVSGVLSLELAFCGFVDGGPGRDMVTGDMPEWLNSDIDAGEIKYSGQIPRI